MIERGHKLTRNKEKAIAALILKPTISDAAAHANLGEATLYRWLKDEQFSKAYLKARHQLVRQAICHLQAAMTSAVKTLVEIAEDQQAPPSSRVSAAKNILDLGLKGAQIEELEDRILKLEQALSKKKG